MNFTAGQVTHHTLSYLPQKKIYRQTLRKSHINAMTEATTQTSPRLRHQESRPRTLVPKQKFWHFGQGLTSLIDFYTPLVQIHWATSLFDLAFAEPFAERNLKLNAKVRT